MRLRELAAARVRFGYRRLAVLLGREGWKVNAKRIYRLYREDGLTVRTKRRTRAALRQRRPLAGARRPNERWSMDFVHDRLTDGRWFRILTVVDQFTRECVLLAAEGAYNGDKVGACAGTGAAGARRAGFDYRGQWDRVRQPCPGRLGVPARS